MASFYESKTFNKASHQELSQKLLRKKQTKKKNKEKTLMYRTVLWTLWERERVGRFGRMALKHVKYHV